MIAIVVSVGWNIKIYVVVRVNIYELQCIHQINLIPNISLFPSSKFFDTLI